MTLPRVVAVALGLLVAVSCGAQPDPGSPEGAPTASVPAANDPSPRETAGAPRPRVSTSASRPRSASPPSAAATPSAPAAAPQPAPAGLYRFDTDGTSRLGDGPERALPRVTTLQIDPPRSSAQRSVRDLRDEDGTGAVIEQTLSYARDGVRLVSLRLRTQFAGVARTYSFEPSPPPLVLRANAEPGDRARLELSGDGVTIDTLVIVEATDRVRIGDDVRDVLVVRFSSTFNGDIEGTQEAVNMIDQELSVTVREDVRSDLRQGPVRIRTTYLAALISIRPS